MSAFNQCCLLATITARDYVEEQNTTTPFSLESGSNFTVQEEIMVHCLLHVETWWHVCLLEKKIPNILQTTVHCLLVKTLWTISVTCCARFVLQVIVFHQHNQFCDGRPYTEARYRSFHVVVLAMCWRLSRHSYLCDYQSKCWRQDVPFFKGRKGNGK